MITELYIEQNDLALQKEFNYFCNAKPVLSNICLKNNIIKYFQQDVFYKTEKELWDDDNIRNKLIENRKHYLQKDNLTVYDLLNGFKRSGIHYGYSHFNPLLFKWFIKTYNIKTCYDPCGGWGHRLLGAHNLDLYIYNDLSISTYNNVNRIIDYFNITNTVTFNEDAIYCSPYTVYDFEAMFTCPPYYNIEEYECGRFNNINEYEYFLNSLFNHFFTNIDCKIFGIVLREDFVKLIEFNFTKSFLLKTNQSIHLSKNKKYNEYLYIWEK